MSLSEWLASPSGQLGIAGLVGSAVAAAMEWGGFVSASRRLFVGTASAVFLGPLAIPMLEWALSGINVPKDNAAGMGGFLMGVVGIVAIEIIMKAFKIKRDNMNGGKK